MRRYLAVLVLLTGCDLYFGDGGDPPCADYGYGGPAIELRDPQTGECQAVGGGWGGCPDACGPCAEPASLPPQPDWAVCDSRCEKLDEQSCLGTSGCYAAYVEDTAVADAPSMSSFAGCHATAPSGPVQGGGCWNLDAQECSRHDDCALFYGQSWEAYSPEFSRCAPEPTDQGCAAVDCGPGYRCEAQCYQPCDGLTGPCDPSCSPVCVPELGACETTDIDCPAGYACAEVCDTMDPTSSGGVPAGQCYATCVPTGGGGDPGACTGPVNDPTAPPACPAGTVPGIANGSYTGYCIPEADCGPRDPGTCQPATCDAIPPACPAGTVAGVSSVDGCFTGYCIPSSQCGPVACETLTTEATCTAQGGCSPVYTGSDCTCTDGGCTCAELTFARCETWLL